jgi:iron complex outermembrane receptor protein
MAMVNIFAWLAIGPVAMLAGEATGGPSSVAPTEGVADMDIDELVKVRVSPFDVSSHLDNGYRASNSVSASRFDVPIRDLPFAIGAFTQTFIEDQKPETIFDVAKYSPSVTYRSNDFNEGNANLAIRGFAMGNAAGAVQIFRDGFYGPSILDFTNTARLEIVRGPSSFLYGQLAPGGVVNVITKTPQPTFGAAASMRYGSYDQYRFEADVTGPIAKPLLFRVASSLEHDMSYWQPYNAYSGDVAPSLLWQPNPWVSFSVKGEFFRKRESPEVMQKPGYGAQQGAVPTASDPNRDGVPVPGLPDDWNSMSNADYRHSDTASVNAVMDVKIGDRWGLRTGYAYQRYEVDAVFSGNLGMSTAYPFMQGRRFRRQIYTNSNNIFQVDGVGTYRWSFMSLRLLLGAQYIARRFDNKAGQAPNDSSLGGPVASPLPDWDLQDPSTWNRDVSIPLSALTTATRNTTTLYEDRGVYLGTTFGFLSDRLLALAGVRLTGTRSQAFDRLTSSANPELNAHKFTPQYGLLYKLPIPIALFASYAESFVAPLGRGAANGVQLSSAEVPTEGRGVDLGAKADLWHGRLSGSLTFFDIRNRNISNDIAQLDPATGVTVITTVQAGEERSRGIEAEVTLTPVDPWQVYLSYSYDDAKIVEYSGHDQSILAAGPATPGYREVALFHNAPLQMSAPHLANAWTRYNVMRGTLRGLYVAGGANLVFNQALLPDTPPEYRQTYALYNVTIGYSPRLRWPRLPLTVEIMGKNLADEHYRPSQSTRSRPREILLGIVGRM